MLEIGVNYDVVLGLSMIGILGALWGIHKDLRTLVDKKDK